VAPAQLLGQQLQQTAPDRLAAAAAAAAAPGAAHDDVLFAVFVILPFIGTSLALVRYNWFPASVFVGDTFCYFAGMTFAVVGIHGHFSKTLILLFLPQIFNFLYSLPQLFRLVPCPRHRLSRVDPQTRLLHPSTFPCKASELRLLKRHSDDEECPNLTVLCAALRLFGPMHERSLTLVLLALQVLSAVVAFFVRYVLLGGAYE
jgi:UDP-N-acetylglucosamine--dolichyl-phosphate N-acetylglucosaminephosphotransferase